MAVITVIIYKRESSKRVPDIYSDAPKLKTQFKK